MTFNKKNFFTLGLVALLGFGIVSCDNDENFVTPQPDEEVTPPAEVITPVDFRFLTFNHEGNYGEQPSVSYISKNGEVHTDYLKEVNGFQINDNPMNAFQVDGDLYIVHGGAWSDNGLVQVNSNSFELIRKINLARTVRSYTAAKLDDNKVIIAGDESSTGYHNIVVGTLDAENDEDFTLSTMNTGFLVHALTRVGSKLFMASATSGSPLIMIDTDNITESGITVLQENFRLTNRYNRFVKDKNNCLWTATIAGSRIKLVAINAATGNIEKEILMPYSVGTLTETAYDISNDGKTLYVRNHKQFFAIDIDSPQELDEPDYEFRGHIGLLCDLKMTEEGTLVFINQRQESFALSEIIEVTPKVKESWTLESYDIGYKGAVIFVPQYEKGF